jgi:hypothetical protein
VTASYFDDKARAKALYDEARSWLGTPFREYYQQNFAFVTDIKGSGGGVDCVGLAQEILFRIGAVQHFMFARAPADYQSHQTGERILDWFRGKADDPQSKRLAEIFVELQIPDQVTDPQAVTPRDFFKPGDVCVLKHGSLFHLPIIIDEHLHFVNALPRAGVIQGTIQDSTYSKHLVAVFRLKG